MSKIRSSPILLTLLGGLFTLIMGSYAYTHSESDKIIQFVRSEVDKTVKKDAFDMFLDEYRSNTHLMFDLIKDIKK